MPQNNFARLAFPCSYNGASAIGCEAFGNTEDIIADLNLEIFEDTDVSPSDFSACLVDPVVCDEKVKFFKLGLRQNQEAFPWIAVFLKDADGAVKMSG
ncbi:hypothetical protein AD929_15030 [Gluconobacter potus]|uniref:Uncharacterized protein n=1 Tax=Gluconobacter potus TaxID=2724927 RepID=A0A149QQQ2_9PROT|nr:hypothetical protein AD929_15030 [Gluconobacter potus]